MMHRQILLIDDNKNLADMYAKTLEMENLHVQCAYSGQEALDILGRDSFSPDLLMLDVRLPDMNGLELLSRLKEIGFNMPVIIMTGHASINVAVEAMQKGAVDFLVKPFSMDRLLETATRAMEGAGLLLKAGMDMAQDPPANIAPVIQRAGFGGFIGISPPMQLVYDIIENAAKSNATVFITGESGTGKEICAEAVHAFSRRAKAPFIAINCAAIPHDLLESELFGHVKGAFTGAVSDREGAVSQAHGGTLFLDEIAEMTPEMQSKLLRFLQNLTFRKVGGSKLEKANVRVICATNRDPLDEIRQGRLRQDLYYRLHVIPIHMPPLRARPADIIDLADYFLKIYAREENKLFRSFSREAEAALLRYDWPGNVRQLQNIVRGIAVLHDGAGVTPSMLPADIGPAQTRRDDKDKTAADSHTGTLSASAVHPLWRVERNAIENAIALCEGNIPKAAAMLEISPSTIYRKKMLWDKHLS